MPFVDIINSTNSISHRQIFAICFSSLIAYFDFLIYFHLSDIISYTFFPISNPLLAQLQVLGVFSAGYLARPVGAFIVGRYADIQGRKPAQLVSLFLLFITTLITACLPTYAQAGLIASIFFVIARLFQGMAFGAYVPLGLVFIAEHVPKYSLATYCGLLAGCLAMGSFASTCLANILNDSYTPMELISYGWRIPFIVASVLSLIALGLWRLIDETAVFKAHKPQCHPVGYLAFLAVLKRPQALLLAGLLSFINASLIIVVSLILPHLIALKYDINTALLTSANMIGLLFLVVGCLFFGVIADKNGSGRAMVLGALALITTSIMFYYHLEKGTGDYILLVYALLGFSSGIMSLCPAIIVQLFPTEIRVTTVSVIYNTAFAILGATIPFGLFFATNYISFSPALYLIFIGIVASMVGVYIIYSSELTNLKSAKATVF